MADCARTMSIAEMSPFFFWAKTRSLGLTDEDHAAVLRGEASPELHDRVAKQWETAKNDLIMAPTNMLRPC
jgi:hypothetical protein